MEVIIRDSQASAVDLTASLIMHAIRDKPDLVLGLATGRTMECVYRRMLEIHRAETISFAGVRTFNLDEYIGLAPENEHSYHHYMDRHLFRHVDIDKANTRLPNGAADDIDEECRRYDEAIAAVGGIDLQLLGIGATGHVGFNEPLSAIRSRTRQKALTPETIAQNQHLFLKPGDMPRRAITMGVGTILESRRCLLLATGEEKADIIAQAVEGPITSMVTASALQFHPRCTVILDKPAAAKLQQREYYHWLFENEPEWKKYH